MGVGVPAVLAERLGLVDADLRAPRRPQLAWLSRYSSMPCWRSSQLRWLAWQASICRLVSKTARRRRESRPATGGRRGRSLRGGRRSRGAGSRSGRGRVPLAGRVVGERGGEAGVADQQAGHLVVAEVVDRRRGQDESGRARRRASVTRRRDSSSLKMARSRNSRQR